MTDIEPARTAAEDDAMAPEYARHNVDSGANACYARPATIALPGDVSGKRGSRGWLR